MNRHFNKTEAYSTLCSQYYCNIIAKAYCNNMYLVYLCLYVIIQLFYIYVEPIDRGVQSENYTLVADLIQQHFEELCLAILDPAPVACQLYERRVIDNTYYQGAIITWL